MCAFLPQHTHLAKCVEDANTYLVNDISDPLQRSLTSLQLTDVLLGAPPPGACSTYAPPGSAHPPFVPLPCVQPVQILSNLRGLYYSSCTISGCAIVRYDYQRGGSKCRPSTQSFGAALLIASMATFCIDTSRRDTAVFWSVRLIARF